MHSNRRPRLAALGAALAAGTLALSSTPAAAIAGGTPVADADTTYAYTAKLIVGDHTRACSGVLVDAEWLLTAASCFVDNPAAGLEVPAGAPASKTVATIGRSDLNGSAGQVREVVELVPRAGRDLVMARLASPTTGITPVPVATTAPEAAQELTVAGFGRTKDEWVPSRLHTAAFKVDSLADTTLGISGKTADAAICAGDTGAPIVRAKSGGGTELVALASRSWQGGCFGSDETRTDAIATRVDDIVIGNTLTPGTTLKPGDMLTSRSVRLAMKADGNLVVSANRTGKELWSSGTAGHPGATARFDAAGNLAVVDGSTALWESKTSAPGGKAVLQDRGNFVIHNSAGVSQWASGTVTRRDFNGDGRSDLGAWYDYADGRDAAWTFPSNANGAFAAPFSSVQLAAASAGYDVSRMKFVTGDYNGDGRSDVAAFQAPAAGGVKVLTFLAKSNGGFNPPTASWSVATGWTFSRMTPRSGDFNGDGRDDIAVWYDYANGDDKVWTFTSNTGGGFNAPFSSSPTSSWTAATSKLEVGDFNGDGRDDLVALYKYSDKAVKLHTFSATATGGFAYSGVTWDNPTWGSWDRTHLYVGKSNADNRDDVTLWYEYADGTAKVWTLPTRADGKFAAPYVALTPSINFNLMKMVAGDYNGDGRFDLGMMHSYSDGSVKTWTWTGNSTGALNGAVLGWTGASGWTFNRSHFFGDVS